MKLKKETGREKRVKLGTVAACGVTVLLFLLLVFCTLFGDAVYERITPKVPVRMAKSILAPDGKQYLRIPKSALTGEGTVYAVTVEQGFSRRIYRLWEIEIDYTEYEQEPSEVLVPQKSLPGSMVVTEAKCVNGMENGAKVLPEKQ